jgi:hypothetical protein
MTKYFWDMSMSSIKIFVNERIIPDADIDDSTDTEHSEGGIA